MTDIKTHLEALEEIRASGKYNMMDAVGVMSELSELGYWETYSYLLDGSRVDRKKYMELLTKIGS